jgi:prepilin-type N-terminal cleavage/methylation domain-containing protein
MKYRIKNGLISQEGFTILEILIVVAIMGVMGAGATAVLSQTYTENGRVASAMQVIEEVENTGYWINHDALMAQSVTQGTNSGFPLELNWQDIDGYLTKIIYAISGNNLQRSLTKTTIEGTLLKSEQSTIASNIDSFASRTNCLYTGGVLNFQATSTIGTSSQTRNFRIKPRTDQPAYAAPVLNITTTVLASGTLAEDYAANLTAIGGTPPYHWELSSGSLPFGLELGYYSGFISGIPLLEVESADFSVQVTDDTNITDTQDLSITISGN